MTTEFVDRNGFAAGTITLDSPNETYWAGSTIAGTLKFTLLRPTTFQAINVMFEGEAHVHWSDSETYSVHGAECTREVPYDGRENYFQFIVTVAGGPAGPIHLAPAMHSYNFEYQIPFKIPPSFESEIGQVTYRVVAFTELGPNGQPNFDTSVVKMFRVVTPYDLNENPCSREPLNFEFEETPSGCFTCDSRPLTMQFSLPHTGYCPGQIIPIEVDANNRGSIEITKILISMRKKVEYHSQNPRSDLGIDEEVLLTIKKGPIPGICQRNFTVELEVPAELAINFDNCDLIDINYYLKVELKLSGCNTNLEDDADLILGTIPLIGFQDQNYRHPLADQLPQKPIPTPEVPSVVYPTNTPYPAPTKGYPETYPNQQNGYPNTGSYPPNMGFKMGDSNQSSNPPPYPGHAQPSYPGHGQSSYPGHGQSSYPGGPVQHPMGSPYPATQSLPATNAPVGWGVGSPTAPPL